MIVRIAARRAAASRSVVGATTLTVLLACTLLAAGPVYADAVVSAGLRGTLAAGGPAEVGVRLTARTAAADAATVAGELRDAVARHLGPWLGTNTPILLSDTLTADVLPPDHVTRLAVAPELRRRVDVVAGAWPDGAERSAAEPVPAVLHADAADLLGLAPGDVVALQRRDGGAFPVAVAATYRPRTSDDAYWWDAPLLRDGVLPGSSFDTVGPVVVPGWALEGALGGRAGIEVRATVDPARVTTADVEPLRRAVAGLRREADATAGAQVETGLAALLAATDRAVVVTRTAVVVVVVQVVLLGLYAVLAAAALLRSTRRVQSDLVRSRGGSRGQLLAFAAAEALLVVAPAVALAPFLAVGALRALAAAGVLEPTLAPRLSLAAFAGAAVGGALCLAALLASAAAAGETAGSGGREARRSWIERSGADLALAAVALLGLWQLRRYGAPLVETLRGDLGADPLLVAAPMATILAGAILALRSLPLATAAAERTAARRDRFAGVLASRRLARSRAGTRRSFLLLLLAAATATFAATYATTWARSQQDRADLLVGADLRVAPAAAASGHDAALLAGALGRADGVARVVPVLETRTAVGSGRDQPQLLALDATAGDALALRDDLVPGGTGLEVLAAARATPPGLALGSPTGLRLPLAVEGDAAGALGVAVLLEDGLGLVHRLSVGAVPPGDGRRTLEIPLAEEAGAVPGPVRLLAVDLDVPVPRRGELPSERAGGLPLGIVLGPLATGAGTVDLGAEPWATEVAELRGAFAEPRVVRTAAAPGGAARLELVTGSRLESGAGTVRFSLRPDGPVVAPVLPAYVTPAVLERTGSAVGDALTVRLEARDETIEVVGTVAALPGAPDAGLGVLVDLPTLATSRASAGLPTSASAWLLATDGDAAAVTAEVRELPAAGEVTSRSAVASRLREDPVAAGIVGAFAIGVLAAGLAAGVGHTATAVVTARGRRAESGVLTALGASAGELRRSLALESAGLVVLSLLAGAALGVATAAAVLPAVALDAAGRPVVPAPLLVVPWTSVVGVALGAAVALVALPVAVAGRVDRGSASAAPAGVDA